VGNRVLVVEVLARPGRPCDRGCSLPAHMRPLQRQVEAEGRRVVSLHESRPGALTERHGTQQAPARGLPRRRVWLVGCSCRAAGRWEISWPSRRARIPAAMFRPPPEPHERHAQRAAATERRRRPLAMTIDSLKVAPRVHVVLSGGRGKGFSYLGYPARNPRRRGPGAMRRKGELDRAGQACRPQIARNCRQKPANWPCFDPPTSLYASPSSDIARSGSTLSW
jgi:hypothetical protein